MHIKSINLRNIYSFGDKGTPGLKDFERFNLFIGKNGSGKSNVFRALCELDVEQNYCHIQKKFGKHKLGFKAHRWSHAYDGRNHGKDRDLKIEFDDILQTIEFSDSIHICGNFRSDNITYIKHNNSQEVFEKKLGSSKDNTTLCAFLNFSLKYIFGVEFNVSDGVFERFTVDKNGLTQGQNIYPNQWSSGYFSVLNLLLDFRSGREIICIDEPELHLEPRVLRKLMGVLMWVPGSDESMEKEWCAWHNNNSGIDDHVVSCSQIFIASHSPVLINEFLSRGECSIYEFDRELQDASYMSPSQGGTGKLVEHRTIVSTVRNTHIKSCPHSILDNLGANGADLLQCNGVVWVEGPSDVIYIRKWLEMYAEENDKRRLSRGVDYEFQMFGGTLLSHIQVDGETKEDAADHMVSMFSFSRNAYVVIDGDLGKSPFESAKKRIESEWRKHSKKRSKKLGLWYDPASEIKTIEDYIIDPKSRDLLKRTYSKPENANDCVRIWGTLYLADFKDGLSLRIEDLYKKITAWGDQ
ncbi:MAG: AAA family ATPase [Gammaproteobacteria bacterium]|nr:AAA family ATPase [Gammaproteobacteria bacterium]